MEIIIVKQDVLTLTTLVYVYLYIFKVLAFGWYIPLYLINIKCFSQHQRIIYSLQYHYKHISILLAWQKELSRNIQPSEILAYFEIVLNLAHWKASPNWSVLSSFKDNAKDGVKIDKKFEPVYCSPNSYSRTTKDITNIIYQ